MTVAPTTAPRAAPRAVPRAAPLPAKIAPLPARRLVAPGGPKLGPLVGARVRVQRIHPRTVGEQMRRTVALVGKAIREGATYLPLRDHVARVAATAPPKDFRAQAHAIYRDFVRRWRYVRDPRNAEFVATSGPAIWNLVYGGGVRRGVGDCDDACGALGAAMHSAGFPVRIKTSVPLRHRFDPRLRRLPGHIYPEIYVKPLGWIAADPVVWPQHGLGHQPPALRRYTFDLWGKPIGGASLHGADELYGEEGGTMYGASDDIQGWADYGLAEHGYALGYAEGETYGAMPLDWSVYGLQGFGATADRIYDASNSGMLAEVTTDAYGLARTPMVEMRPEDVEHVRMYGRPYDGCLGLGDDGSVYQWRPSQGFALGGFFKKIFGGVAKMAMKLARKGLKFAKKLIAKMPGGKYLVKFMDKIHKVAMKLVRPLLKLVGPLAKFLAPISAMIPGYGPLISVALKGAGTISKLMLKHGIRQTKKGAVIPSSAKGMAAFKAELKQEAENKRKAIAAARASGKLDPRHVPAGTPEHVAVLRAIGVQLPKGSAPAVSEGLAFGNPGRRRRRRKPAAAAAPEAPESQIPTSPEAAPVEFAWW